MILEAYAARANQFGEVWLSLVVDLVHNSL